MIEELFDNSPAGYFSFYDDGSLFVYNQTFADLLGYNKDELSGKNVDFIFTISARIFYNTHLFPLVKMHGHAEEIFLTLLAKNSDHLPVLLNAKRTEGDKPFTSCSFIVVANRKKFEDELVAARNTAQKALKDNSQLIEAKEAISEHAELLDAQITIVNQQNNELKQLNHVVTHNLREPVRKILLFSERVMLKEADPEKNPDLQKLTAAGLQMKSIITDLQQYLWLNDALIRIITVNVPKIIELAAERLKEESGEDLLEITVGNIPDISADPDQLQLLFYHLLSNAVKFRRGEKAVVTISATILKENRFKGMEGKYEYTDHIKIDVRDEGIGFDINYKHNIFDLFKRLHFMKGQGLGLALCRKIVANHSGTIEAESKINAYTVMSVILPLSQPG